ncbi:cupin-like domain-containing protein [Undibacterium squillarum]|nr:cupin-like domain-containing protein [Undibacterium squillarum]
MLIRRALKLRADEVKSAITRLDTPLLIQNSPEFADFCADWNLQNLRSMTEDQLVSIVTANREQEATRFREVSLHQFLNSLHLRHQQDFRYLKEFPLNALHHELPKALAQHRFIPKSGIAGNAWIGSGQTTTGTHFDLFDNLLFQVDGSKAIWLAPPYAISRQQYSRKYDRFARLATTQLAELPDAVRIEVQRGDLLFIPRRWWHQVQNLTPSFTVSGFHYSRTEILTRAVPEYLRHGAHCINPLRRECTCHV